MKALQLNYWGHTRVWWLVLLVGVLMIIGGFAYWFWPAWGYAVTSQLFGWLLVMVGVVQLCVASGRHRPRRWGWWIAGGVIDIFVGFLLVRSVILSEILLPYFLSFIFLYWGFESIVGAIAARQRRFWWVSLVNGILLLFIGYFFLEAGWVQNMFMISSLTSLAFIYWGFTLALTACDMRPDGSDDDDRDDCCEC